jgi:hypothetical protein
MVQHELDCIEVRRRPMGQLGWGKVEEGRRVSQLGESLAGVLAGELCFPLSEPGRADALSERQRGELSGDFLVFLAAGTGEELRQLGDRDRLHGLCGQRRCAEHRGQNSEDGELAHGAPCSGMSTPRRLGNEPALLDRNSTTNAAGMPAESS